MNRTPVVVVAMIAIGCRKQAASTESSRWVALPPFPIEIQIPSYATIAAYNESPDPHAPAGVLISARQCVLVVAAGSRGDLPAQERAVVALHDPTTSKIMRTTPPDAGGSGLFVEYQVEGVPAKTSFRFEQTIGATTYRCEPFVARQDVACEERACRSLRAPVMAPAAP